MLLLFNSFVSEEELSAAKRCLFQHHQSPLRLHHLPSQLTSNKLGSVVICLRKFDF